MAAPPHVETRYREAAQLSAILAKLQSQVRSLERESKGDPPTQRE